MLKKRRPQTEPEDVHKIHSIAAFRYAYDKLGRTLSLNTCEKQESTRSKSNTVDGAERPPYFKFGGDMGHTGYSLHIERKDCGSSSDYKQDKSRTEPLGTVPRKMHAYVMRNDKITEIT